jgi:hypothetical protein
MVGGSVSRSVDISNSGTAAVNLSNFKVVGDFVIDQRCTKATLAPGESCSMTLAYLPTISGEITGNMSFDSNAPGSPHQVKMTGRGCTAFSLIGSRTGVLSCGR